MIVKFFLMRKIFSKDDVFVTSNSMIPVCKVGVDAILNSMIKKPGRRIQYLVEMKFVIMFTIQCSKLEVDELKRVRIKCV